MARPPAPPQGEFRTGPAQNQNGKLLKEQVSAATPPHQPPPPNLLPGLGALTPVPSAPGRRRRRARPPPSPLGPPQVQVVRGLDGGLGVARIPDELTFDKGAFVVMRCCQQMLQALSEDGERRPIVVGLGGPRGSGKHEFQTRLKSFLPGILTVRVRNYIDPSLKVDENLDGPDTIDFATLQANIASLKSARRASLPQRAKDGALKAPQEIDNPQLRVVLVMGEYALHKTIRRDLDFLVSISGGIHFDLIKRIKRDVFREKSHTAKNLISQITETVFPMYRAWIADDLAKAEVRIRNEFNPFSGLLQSANYSLKSEATVPDEAIKAAVSQLAAGRGMELDPEDLEAKEEETTDIYLLPPGEDQETCKDWIRMRLRAGRYSMHFEEYVTDGPLVISPALFFPVQVQVLSGLMTLGYTIGAILKRQSRVFKVKKNEQMGSLVIKQDTIQQFHRTFIHITGTERQVVEEAGTLLGLGEKGYLPRSYIEQVQLERLTIEFNQQEELEQELLSGRDMSATDTPPRSPSKRSADLDVPSPSALSSSPGGTGIMTNANKQASAAKKRLFPETVGGMRETTIRSGGSFDSLSQGTVPAVLDRGGPEPQTQYQDFQFVKPTKSQAVPKGGLSRSFQGNKGSLQDPPGLTENGRRESRSNSGASSLDAAAATYSSDGYADSETVELVQRLKASHAAVLGTVDKLLDRLDTHMEKIHEDSASPQALDPVKKYGILSFALGSTMLAVAGLMR